MRTMTRKKAAVLAGLAILAGCSKKAPPQPPPPPNAPAPATPAPIAVASVDLGKRIGADHRIMEPASTFGVHDTIYASVATTGSGTSHLAARWTFETNQVVDSTGVPIQPSGPAVTEFHIIKPSGWPVGKYRLEILLDGARAAEKYFDVTK